MRNCASRTDEGERDKNKGESSRECEMKKKKGVKLEEMKAPVVWFASLNYPFYLIFISFISFN